jgi:His-Xaa-Ser system radical SAM maturase HxsC
MIPLSAYGKAEGIRQSIIGRVTFEDMEPKVRGDHVRVLRTLDGDEDLSGYAGLLVEAPAFSPALPLVHSLAVGHLQAGDVVALEQRGHVRTLYRRASPHNAIFATDRCNSLCLMCSQPPKNVDDQWRVTEHLRLIELIDPATKELGISGGEPALLKDGLIEIVAKCKECLPQTALHILSNGRLFSYRRFAKKLGAVGHQDLMIGVPLYSDVDDRHDHVVQARGAFDETLLGLQNLGAAGVPVEIRVVVHAQTWERLPQVAEFVYRNLTFASHVMFMGLELMGFAVPNLELLWVDPWDYREKLAEATLFLAARGVPVSVYNHQLCTVSEAIWPYCRKAISDWKNEYLPACDNCGVRVQCGGFFSSVANRRHSRHIEAVADPAGRSGRMIPVCCASL